MVNLNGTIVADAALSIDNRAFLYGDGIFETVRIINDRVLFLEDHYFRLMSGMRIVRMEIPMHFTMEFLEYQLLETARANNASFSGRARITVYRNPGGRYLPKDQNVGFLITAEPLEKQNYHISSPSYEVDLYKDFYISAQLLSTIKSTNRLLNVTGSIFAYENGLANCLLLNDSKQVIEALNANLFMLRGRQLITPPLSEGCLNGVMRKQILTLARVEEGIEVLEAPISPFDLQKADELFLTNVIMGIQPVTRYRKKEFATDFAALLLTKLNAKVQIS